MNNHPKRVNNNHFSTEKFPEVIGFCDRDDSTHILNGKEESYEYRLHGRTLYRLKKLANQWELVELHNNTIHRISAGRSLGMVLWQGLRFVDTDKSIQEERVNILFPAQKAEVEKALTLMYYYGGYPNNFLQMTPELLVIIERFVDPTLTFLAFSYVPIQYLQWLRDQLKDAGILHSGTSRTMWVYKK